MLPANDVDASPLDHAGATLPAVARRHHVNLCCASSVEPMVAEVAHCLEGLGFATTVICGAAARASLLGGDAEADAQPTIHVVCVQGQLRDRVLGPLRRALADRDRPNQHLFVAILDLAMPLAMVGQIRRFSDTLDDAYGVAPSPGTGAERRQWREHFGARGLGDVPTRNYRALQFVDRTTPAGGPQPGVTKPRRRPAFSSTAKLTRVGSTGKYQAIAAGRVTELPDDAEATLDGDEVSTLSDGQTLEDHDGLARTARYRIDDMLDTGSHSTVDSLDGAPLPKATSPSAPPRVGLASLLADGPLPVTSTPTPLLSGVPTPVDDDQVDAATTAPDGDEAEHDDADASDEEHATPAAMAKLTLRRVPTGTFPQIVEKPMKRSALGDRGVGRWPAVGSSQSGTRKVEPDADDEPDAEVAAGATERLADDEPPPELEADPDETNPEAPASEPNALAVDPQTEADTDRSSSSAWLWLGGAAAIAGIAWLSLRPTGRPPATTKPAVRAAADTTSPAPPPEASTAVSSLAPATNEAPQPSQPRRPQVTPPAAVPRATPPPPPRGNPAPMAAAIVPNDADTDEAAPTPPDGSDGASPDHAGQPESDSDAARPPSPADSQTDDTAAPAPTEAGGNAAQALAAAADARTIQSVGPLYVARPRGPKSTSWHEATARCRSLRVAGVEGWRLPWRKELKSIAVTLAFRRGIWWSRSEVREDADMVYGLDARSRALGEYMKSEVTGEVLCVQLKPE